jgi:hypothetical protein
VAENLESLWAIAGHGLIPMSAQQLIDCAPAASGCDGGISNEGFEVWITIRLGLLVPPSFTVTPPQPLLSVDHECWRSGERSLLSLHGND